MNTDKIASRNRQHNSVSDINEVRQEKLEARAEEIIDELYQNYHVWALGVNLDMFQFLKAYGDETGFTYACSILLNDEIVERHEWNAVLHDAAMELARAE